MKHPVFAKRLRSSTFYIVFFSEILETFIVTTVIPNIYFAKCLPSKHLSIGIFSYISNFNIFEYFKFSTISKILSNIHNKVCFNPIRDGLFQGCARMGGGKKAPLPKICHTYPTIMKLGTVISYLKKILKVYESRDTPLGFC